MEPGEEQADPAKFVDPLFEERDQNLAVENGEGARIQRRRLHSLARQALLKQILIQILIIWREISDWNWRQNNISSL